jgi:CBS domain-containing protein
MPMLIKSDPFIERLAHLGELNGASVEETDTYARALSVLREHKSGALLVCRKGKVTGIFTERDVLNKCLLEDVPAKTPMSELMTKAPVTIAPDSTVGDAIDLMHKKKVRNLPVVDAKGRPAGLLTVGRIIRHLADHFQAEVVNLPPKPGQISKEVEGA